MSPARGNQESGLTLKAAAQACYSKLRRHPEEPALGVSSGCLWGERGGAAELGKPPALYAIPISTLGANTNFSKTRLKAKIRDTSGKKLQYHKLKNP